MSRTATRRAWTTASRMAPDASGGLPRLVRTLAGLAGWRRALAALGLGAIACLAMPPFNLVPVLLPSFTGLVWLRDAGAIHQLNWADAVAAVNALASPQCGLSDGSVAGDWRMPTRNEMQSLSDRNQTNHADYFNNTFRYADESLYQSAVFTGFVSLQYYWTSTTYAADTTQAWTVYSCDFGVYDMPKVIPDGSPMLGYTLAVR